MYTNKYLEECLKENKGSSYVLQGYDYTQYNKFKEDILVIDELHFIFNYQDQLQLFKETLVKADIKEFVLTASSSALMDYIHALASFNIKIKDIAIVTEVRTNIRNSKEIKTQGLLMQVEA